MKITHLYVADHHMIWNGINLEPGDLYGHAEWYGLIYSHVPAGPNCVYFECINAELGNPVSNNSELPMVTHWETADGRVFFDPIDEMPEEFFPCALSNKFCWDASIVTTLLDECSENEEVALYIDGNDAYFFIHPVYSSPDSNQYGKCVDTWHA